MNINIYVILSELQKKRERLRQSNKTERTNIFSEKLTERKLDKKNQTHKWWVWFLLVSALGIILNLRVKVGKYQ